MFGHRYFGRRYFGPHYFGPTVIVPVPVTGQFVTVNVGSVVVTNGTVVQVTGQSVTASVGTVSFHLDCKFPVTGQSVTVYAGKIEQAVVLQGNSMAAFVGNVVNTSWDPIADTSSIWVPVSTE